MKWLGYGGVAVLLTVAVGFGFYVLALVRPITLAQPVVVEIPEGSGIEGTVQALWQAQVIPARWPFLLHVVFTGQRSNVRAGRYTFSGTVTVPTIIDIVTQKTSLDQEVQITLVEGWTNAQMTEALAAAGLVDASDFLQLADSSNLAEWLTDQPNTLGLQGFLFPDTYRFFVSATEADIVERLVQTFDRRFTADLNQTMTRQGRSLYQVVTLASIVEKEARALADKKIVAGIFWKRLDSNARLESDATINFITKKNTTTPSAIDLQVESAYNTYRNTGLPPTPICNPGLDSLTAVVEPTPTDYWFFLTTPSGEMKYSATYEEHLQYKEQYYP